MWIDEVTWFLIGLKRKVEVKRWNHDGWHNSIDDWWTLFFAVFMKARLWSTSHSVSVFIKSMHFLFLKDVHQIVNIYHICLSAAEDVDHLLIHCKFTKRYATSFSFLAFHGLCLLLLPCCCYASTRILELLNLTCCDPCRGWHCLPPLEEQKLNSIKLQNVWDFELLLGLLYKMNSQI